MIRLSKTCGMCAGAKYAYDTARAAVEQRRSGRVFLYKKLLHNSEVIHDLQKRGACLTETVPSGLAADDTLIIRAHGESAAFFNRLADAHINFIDCTCKKVRDIHALIEQKYRAGYTIIIAGDKEHAEVTGSAGWCDNQAYIISHKDDIAALPAGAEKLFVIAQTTFNEDAFKMLAEAVSARYRDHTVEVRNSVCDAQRRIGDDSAALAAGCRTMIVLGSAESANTRELVEKCAKAGARTLLIDGREKLYQTIFHSEPALDMSGDMGVTGGASTLRSTILECKALLEWTLFYRSAYGAIHEALTDMRGQLRETNPILDRILSQCAALALSPKAKYLRGALIALGYRMGRPETQAHNESIRLAAAYELLETAILIHDDVFDNAVTRRSLPTIHEQTAALYRAAGGTANMAPLCAEAGRAAAICAGDIVFYLVNSLILRDFAGHSQLAAVLAALQELVITTIKGEMLDVLLPLEEQMGLVPDGSLEELVLSVDTMKTATYTTIGPLTLGMLLAGAGAGTIALTREFALHLGIAFQIADDLLDIFGGGQEKQQGADIAEYKMTVLYTAVSANAACKEQLLKDYGKEAGEERLLRVRKIMEESGARAAAERRIEQELSQCAALLEKMTFIDEADAERLRGFMMYLELRAHSCASLVPIA